MKHTRRIQIVALMTLIFATLVACASQQSNVAPEAAALTASSSAEPAPYIIQPGDQLDIKFFYNPEINETVTVRPDGKISLQLVDEVQAAGLRPSQLDDMLTKKYSYELKKPMITVIVKSSQLDDMLTKKYSYELKKPMITVIVKSFEGQRIYVGGEVNRQGLIQLAGGMTPLQAILDAGGFKETAKPEGAIVIRKGPGNKPVPIKINLADAMQGKNSSAHFLLQSSDIIYVPKTAIAKANKFVNQYIEDLLLFRGVSLGFSYELHSDDND